MARRRFQPIAAAFRGGGKVVSKKHADVARGRNRPGKMKSEGAGRWNDASTLCLCGALSAPRAAFVSPDSSLFRSFEKRRTPQDHSRHTAAARGPAPLLGKKAGVSVRGRPLRDDTARGLRDPQNGAARPARELRCAPGSLSRMSADRSKSSLTCLGIYKYSVGNPTTLTKSPAQRPGLKASK